MASKVKAGEAYVEVTIENADRVELAFHKLRESANRVKSAVASLTKGFKSLSDALKIWGGRVATLASEFSATGDAFDKMSGRLGISAQSLSEYAFAADRCGASLENVENAVKNIQKKLVEAQNGSDGARKAFEQLGLSVSDLVKLSPEAQFEAVARAVGSIQDPTLRAGAAIRLMRDAGQRLLPLFNEGPEGLSALREEARKLGATLSDDDAKLGAGYVDAITNLKASWQGLKNAVGAAVVPSVQKAVEALTAQFLRVQEIVKRYKSEILSFFGSSRGPSYSDQAQNQLARGDESRKESQADLDRLKTLRDISNEQGLNNSQINEAERLAQKLRDAYGDVGIEIDKTTGKIKVATDAQRELNKRMLEAQKRELEAALDEARNNANYHAASLKVAGEESGNISAWDRFKGGYGKNGMGAMGWLGSKFAFSKEEKNLAILQGRDDFESKVRAQVQKSSAEAQKLAAQLEEVNAKLEDVPTEPMEELIETEEEYQKKLEDRQKALEAVADYEKKRADENRSSVEREIQKIEEETNAYREQLATLKKLTEEELRRQEARAKRLADALKDEEDETRRGELQSELDDVNTGIEASRSALAEYDAKDARAVQDQKERRSAAAQKTIDAWDRKYNGKEESDAQSDQKEADEYRDALKVKWGELSDEWGRLLAERMSAQTQAEIDEIDAQIKDVETRMNDVAEKSANADKTIADKKAEEKNEKDKAASDRILQAAERFMSPAEKFQVAAVQLDQAVVDLAQARESGDKEQIASALERLGEAQDKYEGAASASAKISDGIRSLGGSFDAWQAASLSTKASNERKLYDETRRQTAYLAEIARKTGQAAFG